MGLTLHGIKYPEMADIPNVPDDLGGLAKLDQTTQAWLAQLDAANVAKLGAMNTRCAATETSISTLNTSITTATTRQNAQQTSVNAVTTRNDNVNSRLTARDAALASEQSSINGFSGQIASLSTTKGRGLIGYVSLHTATNVPHNGPYTPFGHYTFNDPAPNLNRVYRAFVSATLSIPSGSGTSSGLVGVATASGTVFPGSLTSYVSQTYDGTNNTVTVFVDYVFTGVASSQWTLWAAISPNSGFDFTAGSGFADFMTLEDIGLQL